MRRKRVFSSMDDQASIRNMLKAMFLLEAQEKGFDTPEEADDFDVEDDFDFEPFSPYEIKDMVEENEEVAEGAVVKKEEEEIPLPSDDTLPEDATQEEILKHFREKKVALHEFRKLRPSVGKLILEEWANQLKD